MTASEKFNMAHRPGEDDGALFVEKRSDGVWCEYAFITLGTKCERIRKSLAGKVKCSKCGHFYHNWEEALKVGVELDRNDERNAGIAGFQTLDGHNMNPTSLSILIRCNECKHCGPYKCKPNPLWNVKS